MANVSDFYDLLYAKTKKHLQMSLDNLGDNGSL